jgi:hypothetical protein
MLFTAATAQRGCAPSITLAPAVRRYHRIAAVRASNRRPSLSPSLALRAVSLRAAAGGVAAGAALDGGPAGARGRLGRARHQHPHPRRSSELDRLPARAGCH